jgi:hypothetical protein
MRSGTNRKLLYLAAVIALCGLVYVLSGRGAPAVAPEDIPTEPSLPPDLAHVSQEISNDTKTIRRVTYFTVQGSPDRVFSFYEDLMATRGWTLCRADDNRQSDRYNTVQPCGAYLSVFDVELALLYHPPDSIADGPFFLLTFFGSSPGISSFQIDEYPL